jgi:hypothetical protein
LRHEAEMLNHRQLHFLELFRRQFLRHLRHPRHLRPLLPLLRARGLALIAA